MRSNEVKLMKFEHMLYLARMLLVGTLIGTHGHVSLT